MKTSKRNSNQIKFLTEKVKLVMENYKKEYPDTKMDRDYIPFKLVEELGECLQAYLMLTGRGRQKGKTKEEIKAEFAEETADLFGYILALSDQEDIDLVEALEKKWFKYL